MRIWIDLDGTLSDPTHRRHWLERSPPDWEAFLSRAVEDPPHAPVVALAKALEASPEAQVAYVSARSEDYREGTETWLREHGLRCGTETLTMRPANDRRDDRIIKSEFLAAARARGEGPDLTVDDRPRVIAMWREEGVQCLDTGTWCEAERPRRRNPTLYLMVGPSGAGKSHRLAHGLLEELGLPPDAVVSTDRLRGELGLRAGERWTDERARARAEGDQGHNRAVFELAFGLLKTRLDAGLDAVLDATSLTRRERRRAGELVGEKYGRIVYLVMNRPLDEKLRTRAHRPEELVRFHDRRFAQALADGLLEGDGDPRVEVRDLRTTPAPGEPDESAPQGPYATPRPLPPMAELVRLCEDTEGFAVRRSRELVSCDYRWMATGMWDDPRLRECRGLLFDATTGEVAARPFHKFHNFGEVPETDRLLDLSAPHEVQDKHDGTLFYPAECSDGEVLWCTRAGRTELAERLERSLPAPLLRTLERELLRSEAGVPSTPLFEHTSPWNRIVLAHAEDRVTLLAVRDRSDGRYWTREELEHASERVRDAHQDDPATTHPFSLVHEHGRVRDLQTIAEEVREREGEEGIVVAFRNGHRLKMKARTYLVRHRLRDDLRFEHRVLEAVCRGPVDDLTPLLADDAREALEAYREAVHRDARAVAERVCQRVERHRAASRKEYALAVRAEELPGLEQALSFVVRDWQERGERSRGADPGDRDRVRGEVLETIARQCGRSARMEQRVRALLPTARWTWQAPVET